VAQNAQNVVAVLAEIHRLRAMTNSLLNKLSILELSSADSKRLGIPLGPLRLQRAWPRSHDCLLIEYAAGNTSIAGQWFASAKHLQMVLQETSGSSLQKRQKLLELPSIGVMLQADGVDRRLPALASLVARPDAELVSHRPEERAVVRLELSEGLSYAKVLAADRFREFVSTAHSIRKLGGGDFSVPELIRADLKAGILVFSALEGQSLHSLLKSQQLIPAARAAGNALQKLHSVSDSVRSRRRGPSEEIETIKFWITQIKSFAPHFFLQVLAAASDVFRPLAADAPAIVLLHGDVYDKQIFVDTQGRIGFLGFDGLAVGEAALDIANALVHFELRHLQSLLSRAEAMAAADAFLDGYQPDPHVQLRIPAYMDAARVRLACVYAFRPYQSHLVASILSRMGQQVCHLNTERIQKLGVELLLEKGVRQRPHENRWKEKAFGRRFI